MDIVNWQQVTEEVYYAKEKLIAVNQENVNFLKKQALVNQRKRCRLCAHNSPDDTLHEMIIVLGKGNYVQPHKHLDKSESFHILEGSADLLFFNEQGRITDVIQLGDYLSGNMFYYRIAESFYHSIIVTSDFFVFHETTKGPYVEGNRTDTVFAMWAPKDNEKEQVRVYVNKIREDSNQILENSFNECKVIK